MDISVKGLMISIPWRKIRRPKQTRRLKQRPKGGIFSEESKVIFPNGKLVDGKLSTNFAHIHTHTIHVMVYFVYLHLVDLYGKLVDLNVGKYTIYGCYGSHVVLWNLLQTFELAGFTSAHPLAWTWVYSQGCSVGTWSDLRKSAPWKGTFEDDFPFPNAGHVSSLEGTYWKYSKVCLQIPILHKEAGVEIHFGRYPRFSEFLGSDGSPGSMTQAAPEFVARHYALDEQRWKCTAYNSHEMSWMIMIIYSIFVV